LVLAIAIRIWPCRTGRPCNGTRFFALLNWRFHRDFSSHRRLLR
jgi:hypothetical protein